MMTERTMAQWNNDDDGYYTVYMPFVIMMADGAQNCEVSIHIKNR